MPASSGILSRDTHSKCSNQWVLNTLQGKMEVGQEWIEGGREVPR